ncbi:MAG: hypothetical protein ACODAB_02165 [Gemmatimonadota bacterium]
MVRTLTRTSSAAALAFLVAASAAPDAAAQPTPTATRVDVRVVARDAKLIGSAVGGAEVRIRDAHTGEVLAEGVHEGGTGDTGLIMGPRERGVDVFDTSGAAVFSTELPLTAPRSIRVEASGPLDYPSARQRAETTVLVVPGRHLDGDGVVLELWGYIVEIVEVGPNVADAEGLGVSARVTMLCSCPTEPGGLWEAGEVTARLVGDDGSVVAETDLGYLGEDSTYGGDLGTPEAGSYELQVVAVSAESGNAGQVRAELRLN